MPLLMFVILGVMQMGLLMQARNLTQYAVFRATRAGSVNHGDCQPMMHSAIASLIPSFYSFTGNLVTGGTGSYGDRLGATFRRVAGNRFDPVLTQGAAAGYTESILWLVKERPTAADLAGLDLNNGEYSDWDQADAPPIRLETRIVYWYPLRLPFIDWVLTRMLLAQWGLQTYTAQAPYMQVRAATNWSAYTTNPLLGDYFEVTIKNELMRRFTMKQYSFPISASYRMRMMTPPRQRHFAVPTCGFP